MRFEDKNQNKLNVRVEEKPSGGLILTEKMGTLNSNMIMRGPSPVSY